MRDTFDRELDIGDKLAYVDRQGSTINVRYCEVVDVDPKWVRAHWTEHRYSRDLADNLKVTQVARVSVFSVSNLLVKLRP